MAMSCLCGLLIGGSCVGLSANATTFTRSTDNDPVASGYSGSAYNMSYYSGISGSYNNDMRLSPSINMEHAQYSWNYPTMAIPRTSCNVKLQVYLNNANFTDPDAQYIFKVYSSDSGAAYGTNIGSINQRYAVSGWTTISNTVYANSGKYNIYSSEVMVVSSIGSTKQLGADGLIVTASY